MTKSVKLRLSTENLEEEDEVLEVCYILQKTAFSKAWLALGSPGCLFVRLFVTMPKIHSKMVGDCLLVITSKVKPFSRTDKTRKEE